MFNKRRNKRSTTLAFAALVSLPFFASYLPGHAQDKTQVATATNASSLTDAASEGKTDVVRRLLDAATPVDARRADNGWTALISSVRSGHAETATLLLDRGANPNIAGLTGYTPLMAAAEYGSTELIRLLLLHGADPNKATPSGLTPLMLAASNKFGPKAETSDLDCVRLLLRGGADPDKRHKSGATALSVADKRGARRIAAYLRLVGTASVPVASSATGGGAVVGDGRVTGKVLYREKIAMPPSAFAVVRFLDASRSPAKVLAQEVVPFGKKQVPLSFVLSYDPSLPALQPAARFAVDARIVESGQVYFRSSNPTPVLLPGFPEKNVVLTLNGVSAESRIALASEAIQATDKAIAQAGMTIAAQRSVGDSVTRYKASFLQGSLVRIVADTKQTNYGTRTDRFYFRSETDQRGAPLLRAAMLNANRLARGQAPITSQSGEPGALTGNYERVVQKIILDDAGQPVISSKKVSDQERPIEDLDVTAARNFARMLAQEAYQMVRKVRR